MLKRGCHWGGIKRWGQMKGAWVMRAIPSWVTIKEPCLAHSHGSALSDTLSYAMMHHEGPHQMSKELSGDAKQMPEL